MDRAIDWLYGRDDDDEKRNIRREGTLDDSVLTTPEWINTIHQLFPKETIERLERDAIERYAIDDVITNPKALALAAAQPNETLLRAVLRTKHLMKPEVLAIARKLIDDVVRKLIEKLNTEISIALFGKINRRQSIRLKTSGQLDFRRVIKDNLKHYDPQLQRLSVEKLHFFIRNRRRTKEWQIILLVDQSGSMLNSVIHSAVTAACLWKLPSIRTHLIAFDTNVVDLTKDVEDPCELLMKVQLGGGTDIQKAVSYAADLIVQPERAIVILITDFYEGADSKLLEQRVGQLISQRTRVLGLAALDANDQPDYDREQAERLVQLGAEIGAMTPGQLVIWLAEKMR
jgi:Mg-chelatase subunit ChlD